MRSRIAPGGTSVEQNIMQQAQALGAKVWSTPWSPAQQFKSNTNVNGGSFVATTANFQAYANQVAGYVAKMKSQYGINLYAVSVQNEPDANVNTYESCNWTPQQIHDYVPYLHSALNASNVGSTLIMLPESQNWLDYSSLTVTAMTDSNVAANVGIVADHNYDGNNGPGILTKTNYGKSLWETEVAILSGTDSSIANGVYWAQRINLFLTQANVNAWHYWWLISGDNTGNEGLLDNNGAVTKRLFTMGNYSRFVRPNYFRVGVSNTSAAYISAFKENVSSNFAIVAVNPDPSNPQVQVFNLLHFVTTGSVTPWTTSATESLNAEAPVPITGPSFTYTLPPMSVVTFVGQGAPIILPKVTSGPSNLSVVHVFWQPEFQRRDRDRFCRHNVRFNGFFRRREFGQRDQQRAGFIPGDDQPGGQLRGHRVEPVRRGHQLGGDADGLAASAAGRIRLRQFWRDGRLHSAGDGEQRRGDFSRRLSWAGAFCGPNRSRVGR